MDFMNWALHIASQHPELREAMVHINGQWLEILFPDGQTFRFRPGHMVKADAPEALRTELLNRLISIGVAGLHEEQKKPETPDHTQPASNSSLPPADISPAESEKEPTHQPSHPDSHSPHTSTAISSTSTPSQSPATPTNSGEPTNSETHTRSASSSTASNSRIDDGSHSDASSHPDTDANSTSSTAAPTNADNPHSDKPTDTDDPHTSDSAAIERNHSSSACAEPAGALEPQTAHPAEHRHTSQGKTPQDTSAQNHSTSDACAHSDAVPSTQAENDEFWRITEQLRGIDFPIDELRAAYAEQDAATSEKTAGELDEDGEEYGEDNDSTHAPGFMPIVRSADLFLSSHRERDSIIYLPMTDFIGVGLARDLPDVIKPLSYSDFPNQDLQVHEMMGEAILQLRYLADPEASHVSLGVTNIAGAHVLCFTDPEHYQASWFADVDMAQQLAQQLAEQHPDDIPLFVPASPYRLFIVFSGDPHLADFFQLLLDQRDSAHALYPLPHTVAADGWAEWIPLPGDELSEVLGTLRNTFRQRIYATQRKLLEQWGEFGTIKEFYPRQLANGERVSSTIWDARDGEGSIPITDFITFTRSAPEFPWQKEPSVSLTIRLHIAQEIWADGFMMDRSVWPPRLRVTGFPDEATLLALRDAAQREF
ncbi:hypothetical protein [Trueperella sp. LYQ141]|uniref:hypothetical protein n=1 Tax=Trueperella sp. LYQ141 TaxID=3391058 RepID=UPI0039838E4C